MSLGSRGQGPGSESTAACAFGSGFSVLAEGFRVDRKALKNIVRKAGSNDIPME